MRTLDVSGPIHASCVAVDGRAVLILGKSGSGKSCLALELLAFGADLVSDDRTVLTASDTAIHAQAPPQIAGRIEARGVGILRAKHVSDARIEVVVDLDLLETDRLPRSRRVLISGVELPLLYRSEQVHFGPAILQMLRSGRSDP